MIPDMYLRKFLAVLPSRGLHTSAFLHDVFPSPHCSLRSVARQGVQQGWAAACSSEAQGKHTAMLHTSPSEADQEVLVYS